MPKSLHTQGFAVLFGARPPAEALAAALGVPTLAVPTRADGWIGDAPWARLPLPLGGALVVESYARTWPDGMGDPKAEPELFAAWSMGFFGPFAYPQGLGRAVEQARHWPAARAAVDAHRAFVRVTTTYAGRGPDEPVIPAQYDAAAELRAVLPVLARIATIPGALAVYASSGEALFPAAPYGRLLEKAAEGGRVPLELLSNVRFANLGPSGWFLMDTIGLGQLDRTDVEACFPRSDLDPNAVATFLRNVSFHVLAHGDTIETGHTVEGPGGAWRAVRAEQAIYTPPRPTIRLFPPGVEPLAELLP